MRKDTNVGDLILSPGYEKVHAFSATVSKKQMSFSIDPTYQLYNNEYENTLASHPMLDIKQEETSKKKKELTPMD